MKEILEKIKLFTFILFLWGFVSRCAQEENYAPAPHLGTWESANLCAQNNDLLGVFGFTSKTIWFVGRNATLLQFDGKNKCQFVDTYVEDGKTHPISYLSRFVDTPIDQNLDFSAIWGSKDNQMWVVGQYGMILHYNGSIWSLEKKPKYQKQDTSSLVSVSGSHSNDIWAVGNRIFHYDGQNWTEKQLPLGASGNFSVVKSIGIQEALTISKDSLFLLGTQNKVLTSFTVEKKGDVELTGLWASDDGNQIVLIGNHLRDGTFIQGVLYKSVDRGKSFSYDSLGKRVLKSAWGTSINNLWISTSNSIVHYTNAALEYPNLSGYVPFGLSSDQIWIGGPLGGIASFDGTSFQRKDRIAFGKLSAIWKNDQSNNIWVATSKAELFWWNGIEWLQKTDPVFKDIDSFQTIWGSSADDIWLVGWSCPSGKDQSCQSKLFHFDGNNWQSDRTSLPSNITVLWGSGGQDVWAGTSGSMLHYDGKAWSIQTDSPQGIFLMAGIQANAIWAVGQHQELFFYHGKKWISLSTYDTFLENHPPQALIPGPEKTVFLIGDNGLFRRYGVSGSESAEPVPVQLTDIPSPLEVEKMVGMIPVENPPEFLSILALYGNQPQDIWVYMSATAGRTEKFLAHYDGYSWQYQKITSLIGADELYQIIPESQNTLWALGSRGTWLSYQSSSH